MKKTLFFTLFLAVAFSFNAMSQLGQIGLIGTINGWSADHFMTRDLDDASKYSTFLEVAAADTGDNGLIEVKFRENAGWDLNWGGVYPSGDGLPGGANIVLPAAGTYYVTFEATVGTDTAVTFSFTETFGSIGLVGTINGWGGAGEDYHLTRSAAALDEYYGHFTINAADTGDNGLIEVKFRENQEWAVNWGSADGFPSGIGVQDAANIVVPPGNYKVTFNTTTGAYNFIATAGMVGMIGEFNGWSADHWMDRDMTDPDKFTTMIAFTKEQAGAGDDTVECKFRENAGWAVNWGAADFPTGTATNGGHNIMVPIDTNALTTDFMVSFEYNQISGTVSEATYTFTPASGVISMIGAFNGWAADFPMVRDANNPNIWTATRSWHEDSEVKFRENSDWTVNWGSASFPTGTGEDNGANIPLTAGTYDITFNATTFEYSFVENTTAIGEISMVGDFNEWGASADISDVFLVRDPNHPSYFTLTHNFSSSTGILFRLDSDPLFANVWGGTFPGGTGVQDPTKIIQVPGGQYEITFDANSGDFYFKQLGNSIIAPKVFAMNVDGSLDEADWVIEKPVSKVIDGTAPEAPIVAFYGAVYNADNLFIGLDVTNAVPADATIDIFIDGDKSGGAYDDHDIHFTVAADGTVTVVKGPSGIAPVVAISAGTDSYELEASIAWSDLGVTAEEGAGIGFDMIISAGTAYKLAWNGGMGNYDELSMVGAMTFGGLSCGCISLYNETIGDVVLRNPVDEPTTYVGTYNLDAAGNGVVFRKDHSSTVTWGANAFPSGTATVDGPQIPATNDRWRVTFNCTTGEYEFVQEVAAEVSTSYAQFTSDEVVIDGDLSEYALDYKSELLVDGANPDNTVTWSVIWDENNMYIGAKVIDDVVDLASTGNPWDNDAIEMYIDGDNSKDGAYSGEFDTQLIMDVVTNNADGADGNDLLWVKADGVPVENFSSKWLTTDDGYTIEVRLGWDNFSFSPGKGRVIGFSIGNNDNDEGTGRDNQTMWFGTASNWNNTADLGDLELAGGDYDYGVGIIDSKVLNNADVDLYPNPTSGNVYIKTVDDVFNGNVNVYVIDITGKVVVNSVERIYGSNEVIELSTSGLRKGIYLVNVVGANGERAVKKLIIQ